MDYSKCGARRDISCAILGQGCSVGILQTSSWHRHKAHDHSRSNFHSTSLKTSQSRVRFSHRKRRSERCCKITRIKTLDDLGTLVMYEVEREYVSAQNFKELWIPLRPKYRFSEIGIPGIKTLRNFYGDCAARALTKCCCWMMRQLQRPLHFLLPNK